MASESTELTPKSEQAGSVETVTISNNGKADNDIMGEQKEEDNDSKIDGKDSFEILLNQDIFTAVSIIFDQGNGIYKNLPILTRILVLFFGILCALIQITTLRILRDSDSFLENADEVIVTERFVFCRIMALFAMITYTAKFYNTNISMYIFLHSNKSWYNVLFIYLPSIAINVYLTMDTAIIGGDLMLAAKSELDIFEAALTLFFVLEIDEWTYMLLHGHLSLNDDSFTIRVKHEKIKDEWIRWNIQNKGMLSMIYIVIAFIGTFLIEMFELLYPETFNVTDAMASFVPIVTALPWLRYLWILIQRR